MGEAGAPLGEGPSLRDVYGHTPVGKMFAGADVYGVGYEARRAERRALRLGVIGAGGVAQSKWLPAITRLRTLWDPVELVAVADPAEDQASKVARLYGCRWYRDHRHLLSEEKPDAVVVASPDRLHVAHAGDALERGIAALVEKPFSTSLGEAQRLAQLSEGTGTLVMPVANLRFSPPFRRARELVGELAGFRSPAVLLGKMHLGYDYVELLEGATVHLFDLARFFLGDVSTVSAHGLGGPYGEHHYPFTQAAITLGLSSGAVAQLFTSASALSLKPWLRLEVHGQGVWLVVEDVWELLLYDTEAGPAKSWKPVMANTLVFDEEFGGYLPQLEHFLQAVRGQEQPGVGAMDGYRAVELITATHLAINRGDDISLPLDPAVADHELAAIRELW